MAPKHFPLRWESTGEQWWFASPVDWAAANGHYDLVRELLRIDPNLLIKLTSLPRIRRLETVWDNDDDDDDVSDKYNDVAKCRSKVAQNLLQECETKRGYNSLIRAGHGGWLLYTAASAGDFVFVKELLDRDPNLVFGEGEFGVTDVFYAAARSKSCEVFRMVLDCALSSKGRQKEVSQVFRWEVMNRAVHAAARGGGLEIFREILGKSNVDVLAYRDSVGSTVLQTASGRGRVEVVKYLISSYDIIGSLDNRGNTALNMAAYRAHLAVFKVLISASPSYAALTNNNGDTFLHMAVAGFRTPSFRRLDRHMEFMKQLVDGKLIKIDDIINIQNNEGRTALHMAVMENIQSDVVELLMSVRYIDLNIRDGEGNTPLDLLNQRPRSPSSEILIKRVRSAGGISNSQDQTAKNALVSNLRMHGIGGSPGTSFGIPDAEIFSYAGIEDTYRSSSCDFTNTEYGYSGEMEEISSKAHESNNSSKFKKLGSMDRAKRRLKILLRWTRRKENPFDLEDNDNYSVQSDRICSSSRNKSVPLRQQFSRHSSSLPNNKRILSLQVLPKSNLGSPSSAISESSWWSPVSTNKRKTMNGLGSVSAGPSSSNQSPNLEKITKMMKGKHHGSFNLRLMNNYFCFGGHGLAVEDSISSHRQCPNQESLAVLMS